jgi:hypothetical protein
MLDCIFLTLDAFFLTKTEAPISNKVLRKKEQNDAQLNHGTSNRMTEQFNT